MTEHLPTTIGLIWAQAHGGVIGANGTMPWHVPEDLAHFRAVTMSHPVIMGRATWESLPERFRPLPGRRNIVITRQEDFDADGAHVAHSLAEALRLTHSDVVWVMGGGQIYAEAMTLATRLEVTQIDLEVDGDTYAPIIDDTWELVSSDPEIDWFESRTDTRYRFLSYWKEPGDEQQPR